MTTGVVVLGAIISLVAVAPLSTVAVRQPEASPVATQASLTPVATPARTGEARCSVVLGTGDDGDACVSFVHAVPALDPVGLTIGDGGEPAISGIAFGEYVDFVAVAGDDEVSVQITDAASPELLITGAALELEPDAAYVVVLEQAYDGNGPTLTAVPIDLAPLGPEESRLAFHHAVSDAAELAIPGLSAPSDESIAPGETTPPIPIGAGSITVDVVPANEPESVLGSLTLQLEPGLSYIVVVGGTTGDQTLQVIYAAAPVAIGG